MSTALKLQVSQFATDVYAGLIDSSQKKLSPRYLYDDLGSKLFEAITLLPEYGCFRADERILSRCARQVANQVGSPCVVAELGSGSGRKTSRILNALSECAPQYFPIDVSSHALEACSRELGAFANVFPIHADYFDGLRELARRRPANTRLLLLFLGSTLGNLERAEQIDFLESVHSMLSPGDFFLVGADLVKDRERMLAAYDDPTGVTAAFNINLLGRMNRELQASFDLRSFVHDARWNEQERRVEMHLVSRCGQSVEIRALDVTVRFEAGESLWTESSHKFTLDDFQRLARESGFAMLNAWTDSEWPFAETLWQA